MVAMSRALLVLNSQDTRQKASTWVAKAPAGTRVEFKGPKRTLDQNARLWAHLTDVAEQATHAGKKWPTEVWKVLFLHGLQSEIQLVPSLDGSGLVPLNRTSDLSKQEMGDLITFIEVWGAENGVTFHDTEVAA